MNKTKSKFNAERAFLRSCLESVPQGAQSRSFNMWGANQPRTPTRLPVLKQKLLQKVLDQTSLPHVQRQLCGAANLAAEMVWDTACPLLLFPCLFEEMAADVLNRYVLDEPIDDASLSSPHENGSALEDSHSDLEWPNPFLPAESHESLLTLTGA